MRPHYRPRVDSVVRSVRVSRALWDHVKEKAQAKGETVNDVVNRALQRYLSR